MIFVATALLVVGLYVAVRRHGPGAISRAFELPDDIVSKMEIFGRYELDPQRSGMDGADVWTTIIAPLHPLAQADPDRFVDRLRDRVAPAGGWAVYGAAHAVRELLDADFDHPAYHDLLRSSLQFLRERGVPGQMLRGYEWTFWFAEHDPGEPWLTGKAKPTPEEVPVTELRPGELRPVAQIFPERDSNVILVRRDEDGGYTAVINSRCGDDDPGRSQRDWEHADTLHDLYWKIATSFQVPTHWSHPELTPYFPLPEPRLH